MDFIEGSFGFYLYWSLTRSGASTGTRVWISDIRGQWIIIWKQIFRGGRARRSPQDYGGSLDEKKTLNQSWSIKNFVFYLIITFVDWTQRGPMIQKIKYDEFSVHLPPPKSNIAPPPMPWQRVCGDEACNTWLICFICYSRYSEHTGIGHASPLSPLTTVCPRCHALHSTN